MKVQFKYNSMRCTFDTVTRHIRSELGITMPINSASPGMREAAMKALTEMQRANLSQHQFNPVIL